MIEQEKYFEKIYSYKLLAKHEVGQNFLIDEAIASRIVDLLELNSQDKVLEIGSGAGSLSYFLAKKESEADLIDIDEGLVTKLASDFSENKNIHPQQGNIMKWDVSSYSKIIGNLPYYITSGILERVLLKAFSVTKAVFMIQKEALDRIEAKTSTKDYGPLPILIQYRADLKYEFKVSRNAFSPAPHVDSAVFSLNFKEETSEEEAASLHNLLSAVFLHRRKTIGNNLGIYLKNPEKAKRMLEMAGISSTLRPENIALEQYLKLLRLISNRF